MEAVKDFISAALPWVVMGLLLAVYFAVSAKNNKKGKADDNYAAEGMGLGMCLGLCVYTAIGQNVGIGLSIGMLFGLAIGSGIRKEKKEESSDDEEK